MKGSFLVFTSFRFSHRVALNLLLRRSLAKTQKFSLRAATVFLQTLWQARMVLRLEARGMDSEKQRDIRVESRVIGHQ
jgi:hypothetical protein